MFFADPQKTNKLRINLVYQREVFVASVPQDFIDTNGVDSRQNAILESPIHDILHRMKDFFPGRAKSNGNFFPGQ